MNAFYYISTLKAVYEVAVMRRDADDAMAITGLGPSTKRRLFVNRNTHQARYETAGHSWRRRDSARVTAD